MKNKFQISKIFLFILLKITFLIDFVLAQEVNFSAKEVLTYENGNVIIGEGKAEAIIDNEIEIYAEKISYNKKKNHIIAEDNVVIFDIINKVKINSNKIHYKKLENEIISYGKTIFDIDNKYNVISSEVFFNVAESKISSEKLTKIRDTSDNYIQLSSFIY